MLAHVTTEQISYHIPEMINLERTDNFLLKIDEEVVADIVRSSISLST